MAYDLYCLKARFIIIYSTLITCNSEIGIVSQMLSWRTKNSLYCINIWDTVTNVLLLCSVLQAPSYEPSLTLLTPFSIDLAYLSMLFILDSAVQTIWRINNILKWANSGRNHVSNVILDSKMALGILKAISSTFVTVSHLRTLVSDAISWSGT